MSEIVKRRTLWLTDEAWSALTRLAKSESTNPSRIVSAYALAMVMPRDTFGHPSPAPKPGK